MEEKSVNHVPVYTISHPHLNPLPSRERKERRFISPMQTTTPSTLSFVTTPGQQKLERGFVCHRIRVMVLNDERVPG